MLKNYEISEALGGVQELSGTRYKVRLIEGNKLGSTAYYPADVLATYGPKVFKQGTPMFLDHQTADEKALKPFGSITNFVGELAEDAYYENDGLYAEVEVFEDAASMIKARKDKIGVSIRANVLAEPGMINGRTVPIAKEFTSARSVDFVMKAGAGGKIVSILESAIDDASDDAQTSNDVEEGENMDAVLEAIKGLEGKFESRFEAIESKIAPKVVEESETVDPNVKALEIAEAFVNSTLDAEGRSRVLDLHKANGKPLADLIAAEEAYVKGRTQANDEHGVEESAREVEAEESAKITVPSIGAWTKK